MYKGTEEKRVFSGGGFQQRSAERRLRRTGSRKSMEGGGASCEVQGKDDLGKEAFGGGEKRELLAAKINAAGDNTYLTGKKAGFTNSVGGKEPRREGKREKRRLRRRGTIMGVFLQKTGLVMAQTKEGGRKKRKSCCRNRRPGRKKFLDNRSWLGEETLHMIPAKGRKGGRGGELGCC